MSLRSVVPALLLFNVFLSLTVPRAFAGSYSGPVYSGGAPGTCTPTGGGPGVWPWSVSTGTDSVTGALIYYSYTTDATTLTSKTTTGSLSAPASNPLTAKFTWKPAYAGEPAPQSVIVVQHCLTECGGNISGNAACHGALDDGLGQTAFAILSSSAPDASCSGSKYTVKSPVHGKVTGGGWERDGDLFAECELQWHQWYDRRCRRERCYD